MAIALAMPGSAQGICAAAGPVWTGQGKAPGREVLREIVDPASGNRWLLERQAPGAPGRLVFVGEPAEGRLQRSGGTGVVPALLIRAGEPVTLTAHTAVMDAQLQGTALSPARAGAELRVRLKTGGRVVRAIALAPRLAQWLPEGAPAEKAKP